MSNCHKCGTKMAIGKFMEAVDRDSIMYDPDNPDVEVIMSYCPNDPTHTNAGQSLETLKRPVPNPTQG